MWKVIFAPRYLGAAAEVIKILMLKVSYNNIKRISYSAKTRERIAAAPLFK